ncbi:TonB family protein [Novosphingobium sp. KN65.2]|uniref:TonB family protein n=1 Tax=Novosphingobium sp. KN65.2 TaxID=1478134 RepID=UPI0005E91D8D|nr:TonB family protein [Novosphingobium sp. KN65.2]CDO37008.1 TonB-like protein [Novosphingobium sp. KN65.2]
MSKADLKPERKTRLGVVAIVAVLHLAAIAALVRAFTPQFAATVLDGVTQAFTVSVEAPLPRPTETPPVASSPSEEEGAAAPPGKKAKPRETAAPKAPIAIKPTQAPPVAGKGDENASGARDEGEATGASGEGRGTGSGNGGSGQGGGAVTPPVKIRGDINSAKDYPRDSRDLRIGSEVIVALTVGADGRVKGCRVVQQSPDPSAGQITCSLATERFRFRPAQDASGHPVEAVYGWRQRWFYRDSRVIRWEFGRTS